MQYLDAISKWQNNLCLFPRQTIQYHSNPSLKKESEVAQLCPALWDPMDYSLPKSSVHEIFQARVLEWVAISFSRGSSWPRDRTQVSCFAARHFTVWATREALPIILREGLRNGRGDQMHSLLINTPGHSTYNVHIIVSGSFLMWFRLSKGG